MAYHFIGLHSEPGQTVLDPFMGGCSTGEAAVRSGRKFIGIELDPHWFEYSCNRIAKAARHPDLFVTAPAPVAKTGELFE